MSSGQSRPLLSLTHVRGRPSGTGFDESRSAKRKDTRIYFGRVYDRWCAAREEAERGKICSGPRQNKMMRNTCSCSWARLCNEGRIAGLRLLLPFPQAESRDLDARIFTRPAPRLVWSDVASVWSAPFLCRKKSTKNHWIAWQCTFKAYPCAGMCRPLSNQG